MNTSTALTVIPAINTLESEGSALAEMYKKEQTSLKKKFTQSVKMDQLSYRLGKLLNTLSAEAEGGRIKSKRLAEVGIANIDKRRRAEALWFYQNYKKATAFIKASKKGFTSLTALQLAMKKADKSNDGPSTEGDDGFVKIHGNIEGDNIPSSVNAEIIVANVLATAKKYNVDIQQVVLMLIDSATSTEVDVTEERNVA